MIADPEQIRRLATRADDAADDVRIGAAVVATATVTSWRSTAAESYRERLAGELVAAAGVAGQLDELAETLRAHARAVETAWEAIERARAVADDVLRNPGSFVEDVVEDVIDIAVRPMPRWS